jgi:hypothetical protein
MVWFPFLRRSEEQEPCRKPLTEGAGKKEGKTPFFADFMGMEAGRRVCGSIRVKESISKRYIKLIYRFSVQTDSTFCSSRWNAIILRTLAKAAKKRQAHGQTAPGKTLRERFPQAFDGGKARDKAAKMLSINPHSITDAKTIAQDAPWTKGRTRLSHEGWVPSMLPFLSPPAG